MLNPYPTNTEFIQALKSGDSKAYKTLVDVYHHKLCVYAFSLIHNQNAAEDIVQNVFICTWKNRARLKSNYEIKHFLYKSVYNEFINEYRKQKKVVPLEKKYIDALTVTIDHKNEYALDRKIRLIKQEIENLPPKCKEIFVLSKQEGLTNQEIATYKQVSVKSVEAHITRAFHILRESIGGEIYHMMFLIFGKKRI